MSHLSINLSSTFVHICQGCCSNPLRLHGWVPEPDNHDRQFDTSRWLILRETALQNI